MPVCVLIDKNGTLNWCDRHGPHHGHYRDYALDPGEKGQRFRKFWDELASGGHVPVQPGNKKGFLRHLEMAKQCKFLGDILTPEEVKVKQLSGCRTCTGEVRVHHCKLPNARKFNGDAITRPAGECMNCTDWKATPSLVTLSNSLPLRLTPARTKAVVTCAVNADGRAMLAVTGDNLRAYAARIGADFHVIEGDNDQFSLVEKFRAGQYLDFYERILFLDVDIVIASDCPDLFSIVPGDTIAMHDDLPFINASMQSDWLANEYRALQLSQETEPIAIPWCYNTGVIVCSQQHRSLFSLPSKPFPKSHCAEQSLININLYRHGLKSMTLKRAYNWQWWINHDVPHGETASVKIWHAAGYGLWQGVSRPYWQRADWLKRRLREMSYSLPLLSLADPELEKDWQPPAEIPGSQWMTYAEMQLVRKYATGRDYLEIGTYAGFSAALAASVARSVTCLDRFDSQRFGFPVDVARTNIKAPCPLTLIAGEADDEARKLTGKYDAILIDGDHTYEAVSRNIASVLPLLRKRGVLLFHDDCVDFPGVSQAIAEYGWKLMEKAHSLSVYAPGKTPVALPASLPVNGDWIKDKNVWPLFRSMIEREKERLLELPVFATWQKQGIVIVGGGKYFASSYANIRLIRHHGCTLPIELWYFGRTNEMPGKWRAIVEPYGVTCMDADEVRKARPMRILNGWELKPYAVQQSSFRQVLFLDADCFPLRDPSFVFDDPRFLGAGAVFQRDCAGFEWIKTAVLEMFGLPGGQVWDLESGAFVVDKQRWGLALGLTVFLNSYSDLVFKVVYGDKTTYALGAMLAEQPYAIPKYLPGGDGWGLLQHWFDGQGMWQHRIHCKPSLQPAGFTSNQNGQRPYAWSREIDGWLKELKEMV